MSLREKIIDEMEYNNITFGNVNEYALDEKKHKQFMTLLDTAISSGDKLFDITAIKFAESGTDVNTTNRTE